MSQVANFTSGKIYLPLIKFTVPLMLAMFLQITYTAVDLLIVGQFASSADVAGVATGGQVMQTVQVMLIGFSVSITILLGQKIGEKKLDLAGNVIGAGICIFASLATLFTIILITFTEKITHTLNTPTEAFIHTLDYISICGMGVVFIVAYNLIGAVFRGLGDSKTPLMTVAIACISNILLDLLFVANFDMGAKGAAIATVLAQAISVILSLMIITKRGIPFEFSQKHIRFHKEESRKIFLYGLPIALQDTLVSLTFLAVTGFVNGLGLIASAGLGVAGRLIAYVMLLPASFAQATSSFTAQNYGASTMQRAKKALRYSIATALVIACITGYACYFYGDVLLRMFTNDPLVLAAGWLYLKAFCFDAFFTSFLFSFCGFFSGCGKTTFVMLQGIVCAIGIRVPFAYYMSIKENPSLFEIGLATPAASLIQVILCFIYYYFLSKQLVDREGLHDSKKASM